MNKQQTVFVGLSGGVDSSVAALRLLKEGYNVVGVFIKVWQPDFLNCNWEQERLDAMRVAAHLNIPFLTCNAEEEYKQEVGNYFISEYLAGRTPNPDVMCNQHVKFGAFLQFAMKNGADFIATGHYAKRASTADGVILERGVDTQKDQSYFLWTLTPDQLKRVLLPIGDTTKDQIRLEAAKAKIPTAAKKDSQGICFLGHIDIPEFISHFTTLTPGQVLNKTGAVIGLHRGALVYTLGQRHGFNITTTDTTRTPYFVIAKDLEKNTITVHTTGPEIEPRSEITLTNTNWIPISVTPGVYQAQFRYRQKPFAIEVLRVSHIETVIRVLETVDKPAAGQSCVLYAGNKCLGGGIIA